MSLAAPPAAPAPSSVPSPRLTTENFVGDSAQRTGIGSLEAVEQVTMLVVPDLMSAYQQGAIDLETVKAVQLAMIAHCELMGDRVALLDSPPSLNAQQVLDWRVDGEAGYDSKYAALYYPWLSMADPATGKNVFVPPSGIMAGMYARNDNEGGVSAGKANQPIRGVITLETQVTRNEQSLLNPVGIDCIRTFPARGTRAFGRTDLTSNTAWQMCKYHRLVCYLEKSIMDGMQWVVFEPNDDALWARIIRALEAYLVNEWLKGALFGMTPDEAFYVKCDRETNPAERIDAGQVTCVVGVAAPKARRICGVPARTVLRWHQPSK